jgi:ribosomal protein S5
MLNLGSVSPQEAYGRVVDAKRRLRDTLCEGTLIASGITVLAAYKLGIDDVFTHASSTATVINSIGAAVASVSFVNSSREFDRVEALISAREAD